MAFILIAVLLAATSCKKNATETPRRFDPAVDAIAVAPLPPIDESMSQVSLDELDTVPSHRNTATANNAGPAPIVDTGDDTFEAETTVDYAATETADSTVTEPYDDSYDTYDANSF